MTTITEQSINTALDAAKERISTEMNNLIEELQRGSGMRDAIIEQIKEKISDWNDTIYTLDSYKEEHFPSQKVELGWLPDMSRTGE